MKEIKCNFFHGTMLSSLKYHDKSYNRIQYEHPMRESRHMLLCHEIHSSYPFSINFYIITLCRRESCSFESVRFFLITSFSCSMPFFFSFVLFSFSPSFDAVIFICVDALSKNYNYDEGKKHAPSKTETTEYAYTP